MQVDAFTVGWCKWLPYTFPTFSILDRCLTKLDANSTCLSHITLLQDHAETSQGQTCAVAPRHSKVTVSPMGSKHKMQNKKASPAFTALVCHLLRAKRVAQHIANSTWNPGVLWKLNATTHRWLAFCRKYKKSVVSFKVEQCMEFLDFLYTELKLTYYPMRARKEFLFAVSQFCIEPLSQWDREFIAKYVKSIFNQDPPIPQRPCLVTWNVDIALDFLQQWEDNETLQLNDLVAIFLCSFCWLPCVGSAM